MQCIAFLLNIILVIGKRIFTYLLTDFCAVLAKVNRVFRAVPVRWAGTKGFFFGARPYKDAKIKVAYTTFTSLPYTMTPFPLLLFNSQIESQIFFYFLNSCEQSEHDCKFLTFG
jgi:hypothetical protein